MNQYLPESVSLQHAAEIPLDVWVSLSQLQTGEREANRTALENQDASLLDCVMPCLNRRDLLLRKRRESAWDVAEADGAALNLLLDAAEMESQWPAVERS